MPQSAVKFPGPPITSVLQLVFKSDDVPDLGFDPEKLMFHTFDEALVWRKSLKQEDVNYLASVDKFVINLIPGDTVDLAAKIKPENKVKFYRCLFYILMACDMLNVVSFSADFAQIKLNDTWQ